MSRWIGNKLTFVFSQDLGGILNALPENRQLAFFEMAVNYGLYGTREELEGMEKAVWIGMKAIIDRDNTEEEEEEEEEE